MKKIFLILTSLCFAFSCSSKEDSPLIIPPNFADMPDVKNPQTPPQENSAESVARLKELLLKSEQ